VASLRIRGSVGLLGMHTALPGAATSEHDFSCDRPPTSSLISFLDSLSCNRSNHSYHKSRSRWQATPAWLEISQDQNLRLGLESGPLVPLQVKTALETSIFVPLLLRQEAERLANQNEELQSQLRQQELDEQMGAVLAETQKLKDVADEFEKVGLGAWGY
jgi:hypothetical protein